MHEIRHRKFHTLMSFLPILLMESLRFRKLDNGISLVQKKKNLHIHKQMQMQTYQQISNSSYVNEDEKPCNHAFYAIYGQLQRTTNNHASIIMGMVAIVTKILKGVSV